MWRSAVQLCAGLQKDKMNEEEMKERKQQEDEKVPQALIIQNSKFIIHNYLFGGLAQLARASALQAEGQRFESVILHHGK